MALLLIEKIPLPWKDIKKYLDQMRRNGISQFINHYPKWKARQNDEFYWGDEIEYLLVKFDHERKTCQLLLASSNLLQELQQTQIQASGKTNILWSPEFSEFQLESCPGKPFTDKWSDLISVESNMKFRREQVKKLFSSTESLMTLTVFPRIGCPNFVFSVPNLSDNTSSYSIFFNDAAITHKRYSGRNIPDRKKEKIVINIPVFKDKNTLSPFVEDFSIYGDIGERQKLAKPDHIFMDDMAFGFTCCCLQTTVQASDIKKSFFIYDNLAPLCPVMLALSAAAPIFRGLLADTDSRWCVLSQAVDDRTEEERGIKPLKIDRFLIKKSRCDSISSYLSENGQKYNDLDFAFDKDFFEEMRNAGVEDPLAKLIAHLFIRDPIKLHPEKMHQDIHDDIYFFENILFTTWPSLKLKPPSLDASCGWRIEFRPMEVQLSDFENAAYAVFIVLVIRAILTFKLNFMIPISKVDENMVTAQKNDAVNKGKFYFRKDVITADSPPEASECVGCCEEIKKRIDEEYTLMSINEIINGKDDFPGLIPLVNKYLEYSECDVDTKSTLLQYLQLISKRASGQLMTTAQWIRKFVMTHSDYKQDSVVNERITYDLLVECDKIASGEKACPELIG